MEEYHLLTKSNEILKKIKTESLEIAIETFSKTKKLKTKNLLEIYKVEKK